MNGSQQYPNGSEADFASAQTPATSQGILNGLTPSSEGSQYTLLPRLGDSAGSADSTARRISHSGGAVSKQPVRRRISRACDQCNQLRTKCDGKQPCAHCEELGLSCEYARAKKKRGKASKKDRTASQVDEDYDGTKPEDSSTQLEPEHGSLDAANGLQPAVRGIKRKRSTTNPEQRNLQAAAPPALASQNYALDQSAPSYPSNDPVNVATNATNAPFAVPRYTSASMSGQVMHAMNGYGSVDVDEYQQGSVHSGSGFTDQHNTAVSPMPNAMMQSSTLDGYRDPVYHVTSPNSQQGIPMAPYMAESPMSAAPVGQAATGTSPGWVHMASPSAQIYLGGPNQASNNEMRFPVLQPLLPYITNIMPISVACDLLEFYFTTASSIFTYPQSPYLLGYMFRKRSFLRQNNPRQCTPALLSSILWVAAQTSESAILTSPPSARGTICQRLLELTVALLHPLIHAPTHGQPSYNANGELDGVALGGFGITPLSQAHDLSFSTRGAGGVPDDVATYLHLATVVSASEYKAASLRWWNAAWSLARELKLGQELPPNPGFENNSGQSQLNGDQFMARRSSHRVFSEEEREERRRIWWLLYAADRHLALCYNRPLFLLDIECASLHQPVRDIYWQAGEYYPNDNTIEALYDRRRGPPLECTGHSVFGYFLPLMTILGEIVELNQARNHPLFGLGFHNEADWTGQRQAISRQLDAYGQSLKDFEAREAQVRRPTQTDAGAGEGAMTTEHMNTIQSVWGNTNKQRMSDYELRTKTVVAYGTYLMHTLQILLNGKWDPISLLDDNDLWISTQSFMIATGHAVSASEALAEILECDPDLSFMPFFFGIYLLQGSFLLLLIADKLQSEASPQIIKACETIVRAHEACIVTLSTEYQVSNCSRRSER